MLNPVYKKTTDKEKLTILIGLLCVIFIIIGSILLADGSGNNTLIGGLFVGLSIGLPLLGLLINILMKKKNNKVYASS